MQLSITVHLGILQKIIGQILIDITIIWNEATAADAIVGST